MSTLEEHVDVGVTIDRAWDSLHRVEDYSRFVAGVRNARTEEGGRTHLNVEASGGTRELDAQVSDRTGERVMEWRTTGAPELRGSFSLQPIDQGHTRVQARLEYDPDTVRETFGGPKGFAQATAIERLVRSDLEQFKEYAEQGR
ncbi:SRPBCC family protein [Streptomyces diastatochromogenes]|uniref:Cyclase n=1 Tax=Streptomyces diastatochromogenes TaxID=42236 RepID=A0A233SU74_STRDA|nr:SRPBCC family protein [Streptomyces diastatochromogenes]MCZ0986073.1 SRPBCC family protein [Streptomyces diastatochromogenes]OXY99200.1 cyclase [Streptomyces diastatochromogenes]